MDCEQFDKTTMELLYGELDELSEAAALRHLHHCARCRELWGHLRTTRELAQIPLEQPPADLFQLILNAESAAKSSLPARERFSRAISVLAGYAMRPQLAMAALLLLMIGSSLVFVRTEPTDRSQVAVTELGTPSSEPAGYTARVEPTRVFDGGPEPPRNLGASATPGASEIKTIPGRSEAGSVLTTLGATPGDAISYTEAMSAYQEGRYAEAERLFSEIATTGGEKAAVAALHEGHAARNGSGCQRAASIYDSVAERFTSGTVADEASWHAASCYRAMGQVSRAAAHYRDLQQVAAYAVRAQKALSEVTAQSQVADLPSDEAADHAQSNGDDEPAIGARKIPSAASAGAPEPSPDQTHPQATTSSP